MNSLKQNGQIKESEKKFFQLNCKSFLTRTTEKLLEKSPLKFPLVRFLRCLDPQVMAGPVSTSVQLFERLLSCLLDASRVKETEVDLMKREYLSFVTEDVHGNPRTLQKCKEYDKVNDDRLDIFSANYLKDNKYQKFWALVKCLLVLSHGQAGVKRGVSINNEIMEYNFKEKSVVALRVIHDHIQACGGILNVKIDQELGNAARNASSEYRSEQIRQQENAKRKRKDEANQIINEEISSLRGKQKRLLEHCAVLKDSAEKLLEKAVKEDEMVHARKVHSYKRTVKDMEKELHEINDHIEKLKKRLRT